MNDLALSKSQDITSWNTPEKIEVIKNQLTKDLNVNEFALFIEIAKSTGLNPLKRQIYAVKRGSSMTIQTGIDGYRSIAMRSGLHLGTSSAVYEMKDSKFPISAKVVVKKLVKGHVAEFEGVAYWDEYAQMFNGKLGNMWNQYPKLMLGKCAEALALRRAFPEETAGTYIDEEINPNIELNQKNKTITINQDSEKEIEELKSLVLIAEEHANNGNMEGLRKWFEKLSNEQKKIIKPRLKELKRVCEGNMSSLKTEVSTKDQEILDKLSQFDAEFVDVHTGEIL